MLHSMPKVCWGQIQWFKPITCFQVFELLKKYDFNKDGSLDFEEFFKCAQ